MKHSFIASQLDSKKCSICQREVLAHTAMAKCESCNRVGPCEIIDDILMCRACETAVLVETKKEIDDANVVMNNNRAQIDAAIKDIKKPGDFFNDKVIAASKSLIELKRTIDNDASIEDADKSLAWQKVLTERYEHLSRVIFDLDDAKSNAVAEQIQINENLRALGSELRAEVQNRIKELDSIYKPVAKPVKVNIPKSQLSPFERVAQNYAQAAGITIEQARELLIKGGVK